MNRSVSVVALAVSNTSQHILTLQRSCCSACRLQWSRLFYLCYPVRRRGNNKEMRMMCRFHPRAPRTADFHGFWDQMVLSERLIFHRENSREGERAGNEGESWSDVEKLFDFKLKSSLWCFFFHTGCSLLPDTFQRHSSTEFLKWPPPDPSRKAAPPRAEHKLKLVLHSASLCGGFFIDNNLFILVAGVICSWQRTAYSWNVLESWQTGEVVWF